MAEPSHDTIITLGNDIIEASVDAQGAYVNSFRFRDGPDLLLPRATYETSAGPKLRGTHICLPNFGPAPDDSGLRQHGFARESLWRAATATNNYVILNLDISPEGQAGIPEAYAGLQSSLRYDFHCNRPGKAWFSVLLALKNSGSAPMHIAPGFHPYFALPDGTESIKVLPEGGEGFSARLDELAGSRYDMLEKTGEQVSVKLGSVAIRIRSSAVMAGLTTWTDAPASYVCVEPTQCNNDFVRPEPSTGTILVPGNTTYYQSTFTWEL